MVGGFMLHGIDISSNQDTLDVSKVSADFVIVKVTGGTTYTNPLWKKQAEATLKAGKLLGLYHYACEFGKVSSGVKEADFFLKAIKGYEGKAILCLDWEADAQQRPVSYAKAWLDRVKSKTGATPFFYGYASYINSRSHATIKDYPLWMASYLNKYANGTGHVSNPSNTWKTGSWTEMKMYQYSSTRKLPGYSGNLDMNVFYGTKADWDRYAGAKAAENSTKATTTKTIKRGDVAAAIHRKMVNDERFGYSWEERWGAKNEKWTVNGVKFDMPVGDYDCSSSAIQAWKKALTGTKYAKSLDGATYTGNMRSAFVGSGLFTWKPTSFIASPGDLYLNEANHVAMCQCQEPDELSEFSWGDNGAYGNKRGDQSGFESRVNPYYEYPWDGILHYNGKADTKSTVKEPTQPEYRIFRNGKWQKWRTNWENAGVAGTAIYDIDFRYLGPNGWFQITLEGGKVLPRNAHNDKHAKRIVGITVYYDTPNPNETGYYEAQYQVKTTSGAWLKVEHDDKDGGAGDDRNAVCRFRMKIAEC